MLTKEKVTVKFQSQDHEAQWQEAGQFESGIFQVLLEQEMTLNLKAQLKELNITAAK